MSSSLDTLVRMANDIARNLRDPATTAEHIRAFWDPRMRATIKAHDGSGLSDIARDAIARLA